MSVFEVVGYRRSSFKPQDSNDTITGTTLYLQQEVSGVVGFACERIFVSEKKMGTYVPALGDRVTVSYNRWGKVDSIEVCA